MQKTGPRYAPDDYAGFFRRTLALIIDATFLLMASFLFLLAWDVILAVSRTATETETPAQQLDPTASTVLLLLWLAYAIGFRMTEKGTLGYRIIRIRYASMLSEKLTASVLLNRAVVAVAFFLFFGLSHFWILIDERKQALHDKVAGFYVVKSRAKPYGTEPVVRRLINFMMLTIPVWEPGEKSTPRRRG